MPLMSKGEEKKRGASKRKEKEVYFRQCQRGRLLEMLALMAKVKIGAAPKLSIRKNRQKSSRGSRRNRGIVAELVYL